MPLHVSSTSAHRQEAKIVLYDRMFLHPRCAFVFNLGIMKTYLESSQQ